MSHILPLTPHFPSGDWNLNIYLTNKSLEYNLIKKELIKPPLEMKSL